MTLIPPMSGKKAPPIVALVDATTSGGLRKLQEQWAMHLQTPCVMVTAQSSSNYGRHWQAPVLKWSTVPHRTFIQKCGLLLMHLRNQFALLRVAKECGVKMIHFQDLEPISLSVCWPFFKPRFKVMLSVHDLERHRPYSHGLGGIESALRRRLFRKADALLVFSRFGKQQLIDDWSIPESRIHVVPLGLLEPRPDQPPARTVRPERPVFLFFGEYRPNKGFKVLVEAFAQYRASGRPGILKVAGHFPESIVRDAQSRLGADGEFINRFIEETEIDGLLRSADVLVLPYTHYRSQSGQICLAYAYNLPIVASRVGGLTEMLEEDRSGILVEPGQSADLCRGMIEVMDHWPEFTNGSAAKWLDSKYSWLRIGEQLDQVYQAI